MAMQAKHNEIVFHIGDTVEVHYKLIEKEKVSGKTKREVKEEVRERIQIFEGIVIAIRGKEENKSFTVRRIGSANIGIERIFPLASGWIKKINVKKRGKVRRAKLYYLRGRLGRNADKLKERKEIKDNAVKKVKSKETAKKEPLKQEKVKLTPENDQKK